MLKLRTIGLALLAVVVAVSSAPAQQASGGVKGVLTDNSGAVIPAATVALTGNGVSKTAVTQPDGSYSFTGLNPGQYTVRATFPGFAPVSQTVQVDGRVVQTPIQLTVTAEKQEVTVKGEAGPTVSVEADNNATQLVLKGTDLQALPDDPDDLSDALQALAGPAAGPNGGSIYIDGFSGGELPPKESIREIRINQNPFSAEYDKLGFGRIEILTKPGTDKLRGQLFMHDGNAVFNSRNPFSTNKPDYSNRMFGGNIGGPLGKKASFFFDFNRRDINDNSLVNAVYLDPATLAESPIQLAVVTPNTRTEIAPRIDYQLTANNTLTGRFEYGWNSFSNQGIGGMKLPPPYADMPYDRNRNNQNLMLTDTQAFPDSQIVNETRFQWARNFTQLNGNLTPQIDVAGAFTAGGNDQGLQYMRNAHYELQNNTSISRGRHMIRFGVRARRNSEISLSQAGFGGTYYFFGGIAPVLDSNNQPIPGQTEAIQAIEQYRRTLLFQSLGYSMQQIRALGGGPSQFTLQAGNPYGSVAIWDVAPWVQDDWKVKPNLTLSLGLRYEIQTLVSDHSDVAPRIGFAWAPGSSSGKQKTVIRGGFGMFYDRLQQSMFLNEEELNGSYQQNYVVANPNFYPAIPPLSTLTPSQNSIYRIDPNLRASYMMQGAIGVERQLPRNSTASLTFTDTRAMHLLQDVPINTPLPGSYVPGQPAAAVYPYGLGAGNLFEYESGGLLKQKMMLATFNTRLSSRVSLMGNYALNYANDLPGTPSDPYNFMADWGRSTLDRRHRFMAIGSIEAPWGLSFNPFLILQSGAPYDVLIGRDLFGDTLTNVRPAFAANTDGLSPLDPAFYNPNPSTGGPFIPRNYLTTAGMVSVNLRVSKTFGFGAPRTGGSGMMGGGGFHGGHHGGPPGGMTMGPMGRGGFFGGGGSERRFNLTLSVMVSNILNHVNPGQYVGNLNSPLFGLPTAVYTGFGGYGGMGTGEDNRRLDLQARFTF
jgi:hypothetical protein